MSPRIMYIEDKSAGLEGLGRIGRVSFSKTGRSMYYAGRTFEKTKSGYKFNCFDIATGDEFWISGCKKRGRDRLYGRGTIDIDDDIREEYWISVRALPERKDQRVIRE